jgi:hypothetical protein
MSPEYRFACSDGNVPAELRWLQSLGVSAMIGVEGAEEFVEFDLPRSWSAEHIERFARSLIQRIAEQAAARLAGLRGGSTAAPVESSLAADLRRIANHFDPPPPDKVGSKYVADRLGCTTTWIADLVRKGEIPRRCMVVGTGNGKPWKFHRELIDKWIETR